MSRGVPTKVIAAILGLAGFTVAIVAGLAVGNEAPTTLVRALVALIACNAVGLAIGAVGERIIYEYVTGYQHGNPVEESGSAVSSASEAEDDGVLVA